MSLECGGVGCCCDPESPVCFVEVQLKARISVAFEYLASWPCPVLMQIVPESDDEQRLQDVELNVPDAELLSRKLGDDGVGWRHWFQVERRFAVEYTAVTTVSRPDTSVQDTMATPLQDLPHDVVKYLMSSRYCPADGFSGFLGQFAGLSGGALVSELSDWCANNIAYDNAVSTSQTTAVDTFAAGAGVCRDFSHLLIGLCRSSAIPARFASVYCPEANPPDFHAVTEVYLGGRWHLIDPTGMGTASRMVRIGVGRDAADVAFLTAFGDLVFEKQAVSVSELD